MCQQIRKDSFYSYLYALTYKPIMYLMGEKGLSRKRKKLLNQVEGHVLEIGAGTGFNFPYYSNQCKVLACEPSLPMLKKAEKNLQNHPPSADIQLIHTGVGSPDLETHIPDTGFDAIVCTLVLCTIPYPNEAIDQILSWLKPGGKLFLLEHIHARTSLKKRIFNWINPFWKLLSEGCNLNRNTDQLIKSKGVIIEKEQYFGKSVPFYMAVLSKKS